MSQKWVRIEVKSTYGGREDGAGSSIRDLIKAGEGRGLQRVREWEQRIK